MLCALTLSPLPAHAQQPVDPKVEKVRRDVMKVGVGDKITVFMKSGADYHGTIARIDAADFEIAEVDQRRTFAIRYDEVKKVRSGFGGINLFTGQRTHTPKGVQRAVFAGMLFFIVGVPIIILANAKD